MPSKSFIPTSQYEVQRVKGWTVRVNKTLLTGQARFGRQALELIENRLGEIEMVIPQRACAQLQAVPIWLGVKDGYRPCAEYHYSREWLEKNGYNPDKAKSVEIGSAELFLSWSAVQPMMLFHEFAHAYHDQVLGYDNEKIKTAYNRVRRSKLYRSVLHDDGTMRQAYARTNEREYFAECSAAYFGRHNCYPFSRTDLEYYDPKMAVLLNELWEI